VANRSARLGDLEALMVAADGPHVSLFMPVQPGSPPPHPDPIRLKNLLREAEQRLGALGQRAPDVARLLEPARALVEDAGFWAQPGEGLAVFLSSARSHVRRLPLAVDELVVVGERFHVKPLLRLLSGDGRFSVLALSQHGVRLLHGTRDAVAEVPLDGLPGSVAEALLYDQPERNLQAHAGTPGVGGRGAIFHGHGQGEERAKEDIFQYFRLVDGRVAAALRERSGPLVLAGVDYLLPIYRRANTYRGLAREGIEGNPQGLADEALHARAWQIVRGHFEKAEEDAIGRYHALAGTGRTAADLAGVLMAAHSGRVDTLFVTETQRWGRFNVADGSVRVHDEPKPGDEDLLDLAAMRVLQNGGTVYVRPPDRMPDDGPAAAILRY
jgi:hypothetical protein